MKKMKKITGIIKKKIINKSNVLRMKNQKKIREKKIKSL